MRKTIYVILTPEARKEIAGEMSDEYDISITRACKLMGILEITNEGFGKIFRLIRKDGFPMEFAGGAGS